MKRYRYAVYASADRRCMSTHRNPAKAFEAAHKLERDATPFTIGTFYVWDVLCGGEFHTGTPEFLTAWAEAKTGERDFYQPAKEELPGFPSAAIPPQGDA